eukprot:1152339-Pelagomonas_calceolata.AAC.4
MQTTGNTLEVQHLHFVAHPAILQQNRARLQFADVEQSHSHVSVCKQAFEADLEEQAQGW